MTTETIVFLEGEQIAFQAFRANQANRRVPNEPSLLDGYKFICIVYKLLSRVEYIEGQR